MKIAITGSSGLLGRSLAPALEARGHEVLRLVRRRPEGGKEARWSPELGIDDPEALEGIDALVHLAGENIASRRWSRAQKRRIEESRVQGTRKLVSELVQLREPPRTLVCASAVGIYGDRGDERLTESSPRGDGFLADVCEAWEREARAFSGRSVQLRFGVVLSREDGALARMLPPFRMGAGGRIGSGRQAFPWVTLDDAVGAVCHALETEELSGPVNVVAPGGVSNAEFTKALAGALGRPALLPMPALAARLALGEMADELLLASIDAHPERLLDSGFRFAHPELGPALRAVLATDDRHAPALTASSAR